MTPRARIFLAAAFAIALTSCATWDPYLWHTRLKPLSSNEQMMECPAIDLAIDRTETVRWVIRDHGGTLDSSGVRAFREATDLILGSPLLLFGVFSPKYLLEHHSGHYALDAADQRIRELLQLKRARGCPPRITALPGMNDIALLAELEAVQAKLDAESGDEGQLLKERTRLLDGLRLVSAPAAVPGARAKDRSPAATD